VNEKKNTTTGTKSTATTTKFALFQGHADRWDHKAKGVKEVVQGQEDLMASAVNAGMTVGTVNADLKVKEASADVTEETGAHHQYVTFAKKSQKCVANTTITTTNQKGANTGDANNSPLHINSKIICDFYRIVLY